MNFQRNGVLALAGFFVLGTLMSGLSLLTLLFPSSPLDSIWHLNPEAHSGFRLLGARAVLLMAMVCPACGLAAWDPFRHRSWGYWLSFGILTTNAIAGLLGATLRSDPRTVVGVPIVALLIMSLASRDVRDMFK